MRTDHPGRKGPIPKQMMGPRQTYWQGRKPNTSQSGVFYPGYPAVTPGAIEAIKAEDGTPSWVKQGMARAKRKRGAA